MVIVIILCSYTEYDAVLTCAIYNSGVTSSIHVAAMLHIIIFKVSISIVSMLYAKQIVLYMHVCTHVCAHIHARTHVCVSMCVLYRAC